MKGKKFLLLFGLAACLSIFFGCGKSNSQSSSEASQPPSSAATSDSNFACPSNTGRLSIKGTSLVSESGKAVQLRGISTHGIAWFPDYIDKTAFGEFRNNWGANCIRLAMYTAENNGYCTGGNKDNLMDLVCKGVDYATENDMYAIIDWHVLNDNDPNVHKDEAIKFWNIISKKYANNNNVIYEICNEPCGGTTWADIKRYAEEVIPVIRANDPQAVIIVGTPTWSQDVDKVAENPLTGFDNVCYALHFYAATHKADLQNKMTKALSAGLPIFVSEFGICDASGNGAIDEASANTWINLLNENGISYMCWNLSNKAESSALIKSSCNKTNGFTTDDLSAEGVWLYNLLTAAAKAEMNGENMIGTPVEPTTPTQSSPSNQSVSAPT